MSGSKMSAETRRRIAQNRHVLSIEQNAAADLQVAKKARAKGEPIEYVPLWKR